MFITFWALVYGDSSALLVFNVWDTVKEKQRWWYRYLSKHTVISLEVFLCADLSLLKSENETNLKLLCYLQINMVLFSACAGTWKWCLYALLGSLIPLLYSWGIKEWCLLPHLCDYSVPVDIEKHTDHLLRTPFNCLIGEPLNKKSIPLLFSSTQPRSPLLKEPFLYLH